MNRLVGALSIVSGIGLIVLVHTPESTMLGAMMIAGPAMWPPGPRPEDRIPNDDLRAQ